MKLKKYYLFVFLLSIILLIFISSSLPLLSYQEARRAIIIQETFLFKNLIPTFNGEPYLTKPPLHTYLSLPFFALGKFLGKEIFFLRLVSFLSYFILILSLYFILKRDLWKTFLITLLLFSSYRFLSFIYRIDLEPLFIALVSLNIFFLINYLEAPSSKKAFFFFLTLALAFMVRGPLHFLFFPAFLGYAFLYRERSLLKLLFFIPGWLLFLILVLPFYLMGYLKFGASVFYEFLYIDLRERIGASQRDPFYYYFKALFFNFFPYLLLILFKTKKLWLNLAELKEKPFLKFFLFIIFIPLFILSFTGEKFDKYLLFLYPFLAIILAEVLGYLYSARFLLSLALGLYFINFLALIFSLLWSLGDLKNTVTLWQRNLDPKKSYVFYEEIQPLALYLLKRPVKVILREEKLRMYPGPETLLLSPKEIVPKKPVLILPDPYKKQKFWYIYLN